MFGLKYKPDPGLEFLQFCSHEEIKTLADVIIKTGGISRAIESNEEFVKNQGNLTKCWKLIAAELQRFGGNTIANFTRGGYGVIYEELLSDACTSLEINEEEKRLIYMEASVLIHCLEQAQRLEEAINIFKMRKSFTVTNEKIPEKFKENAFSENPLAFEVGLCFLEKIILFSEEHQSKMRWSWHTWGRTSKKIIGRVLNEADEAYRVTIPSIIQIAYLRRVVMSKNIL